MITRPFIYTNRDYDSLKADLVQRMQQEIPEWTTYEAGFESVLLEMYAYVGDIMNFYIDRMGNEAFLQTAVLRESVLNLAQMFGYIPGAQTSASCTVQFTKAAGLSEDTLIPAGTQVYAQGEGQQPVYFETAIDLTIILVNTTGTVTAVEGRTVTQELLGNSNGQEQQAMLVFYPKVIKDSVRVFTQDGPIDPVTTLPSLVEWTFFERLVDANFYDRAFTVYVDEDGNSQVRFGDGVSGQIPAVNVSVYATYRYGAGLSGNVGVGAVKSFTAAGVLTTKIASVTNTTAATGGADAETIEGMRLSIPRSLRTLERAVSTDDYSALALRVAGVAKAVTLATVSTNVTIYVAPVGGGAPSTNLKNAVAAFFVGPPSRKMIGTTVTVSDPIYVPINMTILVTVNPRFRQDVVVASIRTLVTNLYNFNYRQFAELITKGEVFHEIVGTLGADVVAFSAFNRDGAGDDGDLQLAVNEIATIGTLTITPTGGIVIS